MPTNNFVVVLAVRKARARRASAVGRRAPSATRVAAASPGTSAVRARTNFDVNNMAMASPLHSSTLLPLKNNNNRRSM